MKPSRIVVHCLVQNEGRFVWYAINSVLPFVDRMMVWDMGSTDGTWQILKNIKSKKIETKQVPAATDPNDLTKVRQLMLEATDGGCTWIMILDGDEVWPEKSIRTVTDYVRTHPEHESIVVRTNNLVGDIYHRLPESAGKYHLAGRVGHLALRLMNQKKIKGLHVFRPHGLQGFFDSGDRLVQDRDPKKIKFIDVYYHHATHLPRSLETTGDSIVPKRKQKLKYELGEKIPEDQIPEIFFRSRPADVPEITAPASRIFWLKAALLTLPRRLKRTFLPGKHGY